MEVQSNQRESKAEMIVWEIFVLYYTLSERICSITDGRENMIELILGIKSHNSSVLVKSWPNQFFCSSVSPPVKLHNVEVLQSYPGDIHFSLSHILEECNYWELYIKIGQLGFNSGKIFKGLLSFNCHWYLTRWLKTVPHGIIMIKIKFVDPTMFLQFWVGQNILLPYFHLVEWL